MREQLKFHLRGIRFSRITPAYAGTTDIKLTFRLLVEDHPRKCGNNFRRFHTGFLKWGSPPHMREQHHASTIFTVTEGITPACAGTTKEEDLQQYAYEDHPRSCGNNWREPGFPGYQMGSPPLMREQHSSVQSP